MDHSVRFTRVYALKQMQSGAPTNHPASPIQLSGFPMRAEIHVGAVPDDILLALKCHRAWIQRAFRGGVESASELQRLAGEVPEESVLADSQNHNREPAERYWYVTLSVEGVVELPEDPTQLLFGVTTRSWMDLDNPDFFNRHTDSLDQLSAQMAIAIAPYRYKWCVWDGPLVQLPTGITLRPPKIRLGRPRAFTAPPLERMELNSLRSARQLMGLQSVPMTVHFYLRAICGTDRIARFFDAFRALERLCGSLEDGLHAAASANSTSGAAESRKAVKAFQTSRATLRKRFATMALALNPAGADDDLDEFTKLYRWRNDLAHGNRKLESDDAPDEETFELLHQYLTAMR